MTRKRSRRSHGYKIALISLGIIITVGLAVTVYAFTGILQSLKSESPTQEMAASSVNFAANCGSPSGGPRDNAIASFYGKDAYPWTNPIKWNCVYNIKDFPGSTDIDRFNAAQDAAASNGGGVVYFPSGTYTFNNHIKLKSGIVIRGETPSLQDAKSNGYIPASKLIFPKYEPSLLGNGTPNETAFKKILLQSPNQDSNLGIVNLDINRGGIQFVGELDKTKSQNLIIFGVRSNNVADPDPSVPDPSFQQPWQRYSHRFASNIGVTALQNVLVANNRINDNITDNYAQPGYQLKSRDKKSTITYSDGNQVPFHYGNHYGIVVNRGGKDGGFKLAATPETEPGLFRKGIVIRDNWVYHTMRVAIQASGNGLIIQNNEIKDQPNKIWWTDPTGKREATGAVTLENRGIDWSGWNVLIEGNNYEVYRHKIGNTKYLSVDGEGILIQECCGGTKVNGVKIDQNQGNSYIGLYKVQTIQNATISNNRVNGDNIFVVADTNNQPFAMENVKIMNNTVAGSIIARAGLGGNNNLIANNTGTGKIEYSCSIKLENNSGFEVKPCLK